MANRISKLENQELKMKKNIDVVRRRTDQIQDVHKYVKERHELKGQYETQK